MLLHPRTTTADWIGLTSHLVVIICTLCSHFKLMIHGSSAGPSRQGNGAPSETLAPSHFARPAVQGIAMFNGEPRTPLPKVVGSLQRILAPFSRCRSSTISGELSARALSRPRTMERAVSTLRGRRVLPSFDRVTSQRTTRRHADSILWRDVRSRKARWRVGTTVHCCAKAHLSPGRA